MPIFLITGDGGSGKTSICKELNRRGLSAVDADNVPGLARWEDVKTGRPVQVDIKNFIDYSKVAWNWNPQVLKNLLSSSQNLFICGSASNQFDFYDLFDKVFILDLKSAVQRKRLAERPDEYGKDPETIRWIIDDHKKVVEDSLARGAVAVDANGTIDETVSDLLSKANETV